MPESHTGENIANRIEQIMSQFNIQEIAGITTDNAANMKLATKGLSVRGTECFGHTLQLPINEAFSHDSIKMCLKSCRAVVMHFNQSPHATEQLRKRQNELQREGVLYPALQQDVITRWNSTFFML